MKTTKTFYHTNLFEVFQLLRLRTKLFSRDPLASVNSQEVPRYGLLLTEAVLLHKEFSGVSEWGVA